jgi:hypothetical protein
LVIQQRQQQRCQVVGPSWASQRLSRQQQRQQRGQQLLLRPSLVALRVLLFPAGHN